MLRDDTPKYEKVAKQSNVNEQRPPKITIASTLCQTCKALKQNAPPSVRLMRIINLTEDYYAQKHLNHQSNQ